MGQKKIRTKQAGAELAYIKHRRRWYRHRCRCTLLRVVSGLFLAMAAGVLLFAAVMPMVRVVGSSMEPVLKKDEILLTVRSVRPKRGEIWAFSQQDRILLRRVIGLAGDEIDLDETGAVWVNGILWEQEGKREKPGGECDIEFPCTVPKGTVFVLGDDREHSIDSRSEAVGFVPRDKLIGRVILRVWPWERMGVPK